MNVIRCELLRLSVVMSLVGAVHLSEEAEVMKMAEDKRDNFSNLKRERERRRERKRISIVST